MPMEKVGRKGNGITRVTVTVGEAVIGHCPDFCQAINSQVGGELAVKVASAPIAQRRVGGVTNAINQIAADSRLGLFKAAVPAGSFGVVNRRLAP